MMRRLLLALALLLVAPAAEARSSAYQSFNVTGRGGARWQGFSPTWLPGVSLWLRSSQGITVAVGPVVATGTTPPTVTLAGTAIATQAHAATPYVEADCTTLGILGTSLYTLKLNGTVVATNVPSASSGVSIPGSGLTAGWAAGASAVNDVYKANLVVSTWSGFGANSVTQATNSKRPIIASADGPASGPSITFDGVTQTMNGSWTENQPTERYVVAKYTASGTSGTIIDGSISNRGRFYRTANTTWNCFSGAGPVTVSAGYTATVWNAYGALLTTTSLLFLNGTQVASGNAGTNGPAGVTIGTFGDGSGDPAPATIVEVFDATQALTASQRAQFNTYLSNLYGMPL